MEIEWGPVKRSLFDGVGWKIFNKIFTVNVIADGLGHILDVEKATSARSVDEKIFKQEDARVRQMLLKRLSKRLIREVRSCKTVIEAIGWLRDKYDYGEDGTQQQVTATERGGPQKMAARVQCHCCRKMGHVKWDCPDKPGSEINPGRGKKPCS
jgi:hypothetical protein